MTTYTVIGVRESNFTAQDGRKIEGVKVFCEYQDEHITGVGCDSFFFKKSLANMQAVVPGDRIQVYYNRFGRVESGMILE